MEPGSHGMLLTLLVAKLAYDVSSLNIFLDVQTLENYFYTEHYLQGT